MVLPSGDTRKFATSIAISSGFPSFACAAFAAPARQAEVHREVSIRRRAGLPSDQTPSPHHRSWAAERALCARRDEQGKGCSVHQASTARSALRPCLRRANRSAGAQRSRSLERAKDAPLRRPRSHPRCGARPLCRLAKGGYPPWIEYGGAAHSWGRQPVFLLLRRRRRARQTEGGHGSKLSGT